MSNPMIGYNNLLETGTVTASTEATGYEKENAYDWLLHDWWKPTATGVSTLAVTFGSAQTADYFAVFGHNLSDHGASIKLEYSTNGGSTWSDAVAYQTPTDSSVIFIYFASISAADWRVSLNCPTTIASVGVIAFGDVLEFQQGLPVGFEPPIFGNEDKYTNAVSDNGAFIGRSIIANGFTMNIEHKYMTPAYARASYLPFLEHAQAKPFFFSWDEGNYNGEAAFCWSSGKINSLKYSQTNYMAHMIKVDGRLK